MQAAGDGDGAGDGNGAGTSSHTIWMQDRPGGVQIPQLALQQTWPAAHVALPQVTCGVGTDASETAGGAPASTLRDASGAGVASSTGGPSITGSDASIAGGVGVGAGGVGAGGVGADGVGADGVTGSLALPRSALGGALRVHATIEMQASATSLITTSRNTVPTDGLPRRGQRRTMPCGVPSP